MTPDTGCGGDNDPLDAVGAAGVHVARLARHCARCVYVCLCACVAAGQVEIGYRRHAVGAIVHVKVRRALP